MLHDPSRLRDEIEFAVNSVRDQLTHRGFRFDDNQTAAPQPYRVRDIVPYVGTGITGGQSGAAKTFFKVAETVELAAGGRIADREVRDPCGTAILLGEGGGNYGNRIAAYKAHRGYDRPLPIVWREYCGNLFDPREVKALIRDLRLVQDFFEDEFGLPLGRFHMDTIASLFEMSDENSNAEIQRVCQIMKQISTELGIYVDGCHHLGKNKEAGLRGGSAWRGGVDIVLGVLADRDETTGECKNRRLVQIKNREGPEGPISAFELKQYDLGFDDYGEPFGSAVVEFTGQVQHTKPPTPAQRMFDDAFHAALHEHGHKHVVMDDGPPVNAVDVQRVGDEFFRRHVEGEGDPKKRKEAARKAWKRALKGAQGRGYRTEFKQGVELIWQLA